MEKKIILKNCIYNKINQRTGIFKCASIFVISITYRVIPAPEGSLLPYSFHGSEKWTLNQKF